MPEVRVVPSCLLPAVAAETGPPDLGTPMAMAANSVAALPGSTTARMNFLRLLRLLML